MKNPKTLSKKDYESFRPATEQKLEFDNFVVRAYVDEKGLHVLAHRRDENGDELLPLAYMLGANALNYKL